MSRVFIHSQLALQLCRVSFTCSIWKWNAYTIWWHRHTFIRLKQETRTTFIHPSIHPFMYSSHTSMYTWKKVHIGSSWLLILRRLICVSWLLFGRPLVCYKTWTLFEHEKVNGTYCINRFSRINVVCLALDPTITGYWNVFNHLAIIEKRKEKTKIKHVIDGVFFCFVFFISFFFLLSKRFGRPQMSGNIIENVISFALYWACLLGSRFFIKIHFESI